MKDKKVMNQKEMIRQAVNDIQSGKKNKITITLKDNEFNIRPFPLLWYSKAVFFIQQWMVPMHLKNWLLRTAGLNVGHDACIPHYIKFDPYFPQLTYIGDGALIGGTTETYPHTLDGKKLTLGRIEIKEKSMTSGFVRLFPGAIVNRYSIVSFNTDLNHEIPEGEIWAGKPAKLMVKLDQDQINKYFKKLEMDPKQYYKEAREKIRKFQKDPSINYLKIQYGGKRAGAGNDWWRARNVVRIFYNGPIVELARILPDCWFKKILLKMVGVKLGKNVYIGEGVVFDHIYCDTITVEDDVKIDNDCYIDGHEYTIAQTVFGRVLIKKGAHLKHHIFVRTGTIIGENSVIEPGSMTQREIPPNEVWGGFPAKFIRKR